MVLISLTLKSTDTDRNHNCYKTDLALQFLSDNLENSSPILTPILTMFHTLLLVGISQSKELGREGWGSLTDHLRGKEIASTNSNSCTPSVLKPLMPLDYK